MGSDEMVAYNFRPRFAPKILDGSKIHTLRDERWTRHRHAQAGDTLQLYTGQRTPRCQLVARRTCLGIARIRLMLANNGIMLVDYAEVIDFPYSRDRIADLADLDAFAVNDGFDNWRDLKAFWAGERGRNVNQWSGCIIFWRRETAML
jgi:hypothetical protein